MAHLLDDMFKWLPQIYGTNVGTGSGAKNTVWGLKQSGQAWTGYELIETFAAQMEDESFNVNDLFKDLTGDLQQRSVIMLESPTLDNQLGKFAFDPKHPVNIHGVPPGTFHHVAWSGDP